MAYVANNNQMGILDLSTVTSATAGSLGTPGVGALPSVTLDAQTGYVVTGWDPALGAGEFVFAKSTGTIAAGTVVEFTTTATAGVFTTNFQAWAGTAVKGKPLGVVVAATAVGQYAWVQVQGNAITSTSGTVAAGDAQYWQASGVISSTPVISKAFLNAQAASAQAATVGAGTTAVTLTSTQAVIFLNRPFGQGAIT